MKKLILFVFLLSIFSTQNISAQENSFTENDKRILEKFEKLLNKVEDFESFRSDESLGNSVNKTGFYISKHNPYSLIFKEYGRNMKIKYNIDLHDCKSINIYKTPYNYYVISVSGKIKKRSEFEVKRYETVTEDVTSAFDTTGFKKYRTYERIRYEDVIKRKDITNAEIPINTKNITRAEKLSDLINWTKDSMQHVYFAFGNKAKDEKKYKEAVKFYKAAKNTGSLELWDKLSSDFAEELIELGNNEYNQDSIKYALNFYELSDDLYDLSSTKKQILYEKLFRKGNEKFDEALYDKALDAYKLAKNFKTTNELKTKLSETYEKIGDKQKEQLKAGSYYKNAISSNPENSSAQEKYDVIEKEEQRSETFFLMYEFDKESPIQLSFGYLGEKLGVSLKFRMHNHYFIKKENKTNPGTSPKLEDMQPNGDVRSKGNLGISFSFTFKTIYPFWLYTGVGVAHYVYYEKYAYSQDNFFSGSFTDNVWVKNKNLSDNFQIYPEIGLYTRIGYRIILKTGVFYRKGFKYQIGLGINLKPKRDLELPSFEYYDNYDYRYNRSYRRYNY